MESAIALKFRQDETDEGVLRFPAGDYKPISESEGSCANIRAQILLGSFERPTRPEPARPPYLDLQEDRLRNVEAGLLRLGDNIIEVDEPDSFSIQLPGSFSQVEQLAYLTSTRLSL